MALNIKSVETERKARALAQRTGETITQAVDRALEARLRLVSNDDDKSVRLARWRARLEAFPPVAGGAGNWKDEFYDEFGLPR